MARVTLSMDEALWQRAREGAVQERKSLSRFLAETVARRLDEFSGHTESANEFTGERPTKLIGEAGRAPGADGCDE